ncbi:inhibitor of apoptosis 1, diap1 [Reticulomyxa filosa]|uniref:Inhibitor of apoptosis 1, diap1 n=1 Tax=Reticulomyxa filosa TaxID=46433 RepID=X6M821_RETFI|nr:inhibitor of apoptosis 1, diap1 [Reticulomyxa filosa]|eukprot:ETO10059.1 inhibitor of apoptosis 1, diap1 [Reticulomyxa filosa]
MSKQTANDNNDAVWKLHEGRPCKVVILRYKKLEHHHQKKKRSCWERYLTVIKDETARAYALMATRQHYYDEDNIFELECVDNSKNKVTLFHPATQQWICLDSEGELVKKEDLANVNMRWKLYTGWRKFTLQSMNTNKYLSAQSTGKVDANGFIALGWENWDIRRVGFVMPLESEVQADKASVSKSKHSKSENKGTSLVFVFVFVFVFNEQNEKADGILSPKSKPVSTQQDDNTDNTKKLLYVNHCSSLDDKIKDQIDSLKMRMATMSERKTTMEEKDAGVPVDEWANLQDSLRKKQLYVGEYKDTLNEILVKNLGRSKQCNDLFELLKEQQLEKTRTEKDIQKLQQELPVIEEKSNTIRKDLDQLNAKLSELQTQIKAKQIELNECVHVCTLKTDIFNKLSEKNKVLSHNVGVFEQQFNDFKQTELRIQLFETTLADFQHILRCEENWQRWTTNDVITWVRHIENGFFRDQFKLMFDVIKKYQFTGLDLSKMNEITLKNVLKIREEKHRKLLLAHIERITKSGVTTQEQFKICPDIIEKIDNESRKSISTPQKPSDDKADANLCIVCYNEKADRICLPCGHLCLGKDCESQVKESHKCAFCGQDLKDIIKVYTVGA